MYICININIFLFNGNNRSMFLLWERGERGGRWESWLLETPMAALLLALSVRFWAEPMVPVAALWLLLAESQVLNLSLCQSDVQTDNWRDSGTWSWPSVQAVDVLGGRECRCYWEMVVASLGSREEPTQDNQAVSCGDVRMDLAMGKRQRLLPSGRSCGLGKGWSLPCELLLPGAVGWDHRLTDIQHSGAGADPGARFRPCLVLKMICWVDKRKSAFKITRLYWVRLGVLPFWSVQQGPGSSCDSSNDRFLGEV